jgi:hypothetical protein
MEGGISGPDKNKGVGAESERAGERGAAGPLKEALERTHLIVSSSGLL